jgi:hypothetical protein
MVTTMPDYGCSAVQLGTKKSFYNGLDCVEPKVRLVEDICHLKEVEAKV